MTFDNLVFIKHPKELSVVAGNNLYCSTRYGNKKGGPLLEASDVASWEVKIGDEVIGWQTKEDINKLIKKNINDKNNK